MLALLSPAKKLTFDLPPSRLELTRPDLLDQSHQLIKTSRRLSRKKLSALMGLSPALADLTYERFQAFEIEESPTDTQPAILAFRGDTYLGFDVDSLSEESLVYAQNHLRILSGLYGLLRPMDAIQAYRLEMGTALKTRRGKDLYAFWGSRVTSALKATLENHQTPALINLASTEYFKVLQPKALKVPVITAQFKELRDGVPRLISFNAKRARGMMARFMVDERIDTPEGLKDFAKEGYRFEPKSSNEHTWLFLRDDPR